MLTLKISAMHVWLVLFTVLIFLVAAPVIAFSKLADGLVWSSNQAEMFLLSFLHYGERMDERLARLQRARRSQR